MSSSRVSSITPWRPPLRPPPGVCNVASSTWYGEISAAVIAERAGEAPSCRPPHRGDTSGVSAAGPPPPPPPFEPLWRRPLLPGVMRGRRLFLGVSQAGRVTSAADPVINDPGECVSAEREKKQEKKKRTAVTVRSRAGGKRKVQPARTGAFSAGECPGPSAMAMAMGMHGGTKKKTADRKQCNQRIYHTPYKTTTTYAYKLVLFRN